MIPVRCSCGEELFLDTPNGEVIVGDSRFVFRRDTDYVICPVCQRTHSIVELRRRIQGELGEVTAALQRLDVLSGAAPAEVSTNGSAPDDVLADLYDRVLGAHIDGHIDDAEPVLAALSELAAEDTRGEGQAPESDGEDQDGG